MADASVSLVGGEATCKECDWDTNGKNALGNASQHAEKTGHEVQGEQYQVFQVGP